MSGLKLLHTSDWHLGRLLYGKKRYAEFEAFLDWLAATIDAQAVDVLLVAGDVFDTQTPSNRAQALYYRFLCRIAASRCRHVVVIAGNHDSPSFLDAPRELLHALDVHVIGQARAAPQDEVLLLSDSQGRPELIVCAVPYLRDRDIRIAEAGESLEDKERKLLAGIKAHYAAVGAAAEAMRAAVGLDLPIVGMGHLFAAGGQTVDGDGVRELYVGSLAHVTGGIFPDSFDYLALGHLHVPQKVGGAETRRYSGSPIAMGFGEAGQRKSVCLVRFAGHAATVTLEPVPVFQALQRLRGDWNGLCRRLQDLEAAGSQAWLEVVYESEQPMGDLRERLDAAVAGSGMEILRVSDARMIARVLSELHAGETLDDLDPHQVFERCMAAHGVPDDQRPALVSAYRETLLSLHQDDPRAD